MRRSFLVPAIALSLLALVVGGIVTVARATTTNASGCRRAGVMKTVFPKAGAVGFSATRHGVTRVTHPRAQYYPGFCGAWHTTYTDERMSDRHLPRPFRAFAEVRVSLYMTHASAMLALYEPAFGASVKLPNGAWIRTYVDRPSINGDASRQVGYVASVVGNVFIESIGQGRPPAYRGGEAVRAQMRIHRRIQAAVLALG